MAAPATVPGPEGAFGLPPAPTPAPAPSTPAHAAVAAASPGQAAPATSPAPASAPNAPVAAPAGIVAALANTIRALGLYHLAFAIGLATVLFQLWPERMGKEGGWLPIYLPLTDPERLIGDDARLLLIVLVTGALGSCVHAATSFASYVGNRRLVLSWAWWYLLRPFIGGALALIFYFVLRGGLLATAASASDMSPFGIAAMAGLAGMFSKQATDKLREVFDNLFRTAEGQGDDARADKLGGNLPVKDVMIERRKISAAIIPKGQAAKDVKVVDLHRKLGGVVTRIPVLDASDVLVCIIHQSLLFKYLADEAMKPPAAGQPAFDANKLDLQGLLDAPGMKELVQDALAYVPVGATLSDARTRMEQVKHCQDVIVTEHGMPGDPLLGWLTDAELRRAGKA